MIKASMIAGTCALALCSAAQAETTVLKAARYLDVGSGRYVTPAVIVVEDGKIAAINPSSIPEGAVVDLGGITLLPGLMDAHTHLSLSIEPGWDTSDVRLTAADFAYNAAVNAKKTLLAGFTTVREVGAPDFVDVALSKAVEAGKVDGPHVIPAGYALGITGGHCDTTGYGPGILERDDTTGVADGPDSFVRAARYQIKHGAKVIKVCATAGVLSFEDSVGAQQMTFEEMKAVADEAHRHGVKVAAHAHGTEGIIAASEAGIDSIEHGSVLTEKAVNVLKKNGTYLDSTLYLAQTIDWKSLPPMLAEKGRVVMPLADESFKLALSKGVKMSLGTDAGVYPHGTNAGELVRHVELGQSSIEAIRSATINNADLFGVKDRGRIAPGLLADIIGVDGDPLVDITQLTDVDFVMRGGKVFKTPAE
ncbi:MAG TPA: amidohydrolase family protein [Parvularculaceae bacterium]|nr:amidohydrolase family protein [Parvularculaceae bacterium]